MEMMIVWIVNQVRSYSIRSNGGNFHKPIVTAEQAANFIQSGSTILIGGFGLCGIPEKVLEALTRRPVKDLKFTSNDAGTETFGIGALINNGQVSKVTASYIGENSQCVKKYLNGDLEVELVPQGTIAESLRAGGAGIPFFYTRAGSGTIYASGNLISKYGKDGKPKKFMNKLSMHQWKGKQYLMEAARYGDFALVKAWKGDHLGNLVFRETARNFNPVMAKAARMTIAEVEELVPTGSINPDDIHLPGIYVDKLVLGGHYEKRIMHLTVQRDDIEKRPESNSPRERIAHRAALEFKNGMYVNLGIGIPEHASNFIPKGTSISIDSENGVLGLGPFPTLEEVDPDLVNAGKETVTIFSGASYFSSDESFAMIRGYTLCNDVLLKSRGHFDMSMMGAFQVSEFGDLANWIIPGKVIKGMGGAMDLANSKSRIIITMMHTFKDGSPKILKKCTLPLTAQRCAVFNVNASHGLTLMEMAKGENVESIQAKTGCNFVISNELGSF